MEIVFVETVHALQECIVHVQDVTVPDLKVMIEKSTNIPAYEQRLSHNHTILEDIYIDSQEQVKQRYLRQYFGVGDESVLCLVRLTGTNFKVSLPNCGSLFNTSFDFYINFASDVSQSECLVRYTLLTIEI